MCSWRCIELFITSAISLNVADKSAITASEDKRRMHSREIRRLHAAQVYYALMIEPEISQTDICDRTGCDKSTVSIIVNRLEELGIVTRDVGLKSGHRGRPKERLRIVEDAGLLIGVHFEYPSIRFTATGIAGAPLKVWTIDLPRDPDQLGDAILRGLSQLHRRLSKTIDEVFSIGISVPGQVRNDDFLLLAPALEWSNINLRAQLAAGVSVPVFISNDTKGAALAEHYFGAARGTNNFLMVRAGSDWSAPHFAGQISY